MVTTVGPWTSRDGVRSRYNFGLTALSAPVTDAMAVLNRLTAAVQASRPMQVATFRAAVSRSASVSISVRPSTAISSGGGRAACRAMRQSRASFAT